MPRGAADNNASLSHDLSSAIVSVGALRNIGDGKGGRGSTAVTNCRSTGRVRDTSVYAYICFRANTLYNSYGADDLGERSPEAGKGERTEERERRRERAALVSSTS